MRIHDGKTRRRLHALIVTLLIFGQMHGLESFAQSQGGSCDPSNPLSCLGGSGGDPFAGIEQSLQNFQTDMDNQATSLKQQFSGQITSMQNQIGQLQQQGAAYMQQFQNMSNQWLSMGNKFDGDFKDLNTNLANMNTTANKALGVAQDKWNAFGMALAAGGGAVLGAEGAQLAFQAAKKGVEELLEKAHLYDFHKLQKEQRGAAYQKELIDYTDRQGANASTIASVKSLLSFLNTKDARGNGFTGGTFLQMRSQLNYLKRSADRTSKRAQSMVDSDNETLSDLGVRIQSASDTAKQIWEDVQTRIGNKTVSALCTEMTDAVKKAKVSESYLQVERAGLLVRAVDNIDYLKVTDKKLYSEDERIGSKKFQARLEKAVGKLDRSDEKLSQEEIQKRADSLHSSCNAALKKARVKGAGAEAFCGRISKLSTDPAKKQSPGLEVAYLSTDDSHYLFQLSPGLMQQAQALRNDVSDYNKSRDETQSSRADLKSTFDAAPANGGLGTNAEVRSAQTKDYQDTLNKMVKGMYVDAQHNRMADLDDTAGQVQSTCDRLKNEEQAALETNSNSSGFNTHGQAPARPVADGTPATPPPAN